MEKQEFSDLIVKALTPDIETVSTLQAAEWSGNSMIVRFRLPEDESERMGAVDEVVDKLSVLSSDEGVKFSLVYQQVKKSETDVSLILKITPNQP